MKHQQHFYFLCKSLPANFKKNVIYYVGHNKEIVLSHVGMFVFLFEEKGERGGLDSNKNLS